MKFSKVHLLVVMVILMAITFIGVHAYSVYQDVVEQMTVTVVDAEGSSYHLNIDEGEWYFSDNETPFQYVENIVGGRVQTGWTTEDMWWHGRERENVHHLTSYVEMFGHRSIQQISGMMGQDIFGSQCVQLSYDYSEEYEQYELSEFTHCDLFYPDPTIDAIRVLPLLTEEALYWTVQDQVRRLDGSRTLLLGDSGWSGEWKLNPTYFYDDGHWYVAFMRFGACRVSISDGQGFYAEVPSNWMVTYEGRFGETLYHIYMIPNWEHDSEWLVESQSPLSCRPQTQRHTFTNYDPLASVWGS